MATHAPIARPAATGRRVVAALLDLLTVFGGGGIVIGKLTNQMTDTGFALSGWPALLLLAVIIAYFYVGRRIAGGTLWDRILRIARPQPH